MWVCAETFLPRAALSNRSPLAAKTVRTRVQPRPGGSGEQNSRGKRNAAGGTAAAFGDRSPYFQAPTLSGDANSVPFPDFAHLICLSSPSASPGEP